MIRSLKILWSFSRPHTMIGSFLSITSLYLISIAVVFPEDPVRNIGIFGWLWAITLLSAIACNIYITGLNQIMDIEIDRINKPWLPIAAGKLSKRSATIIILVAALVAVLAAASSTWVLFALILCIMAIGTAYSLPPLKFKKHHVAAAVSILLVRGVLVNIGMPVHFIFSIRNDLFIPPDVWPITFFVAGFSLAIAWFKDIPDTKGDAIYSIRTLAIRISAKTAFIYGIAVVALAYAGTMFLTAWLGLHIKGSFFFISHAILLLLFLAGAGRVQLNDPEKLKRSYILFWGFFFVEYIVYTLAYFIP